jgi:hypothetical protein
VPAGEDMLAGHPAETCAPQERQDSPHSHGSECPAVALISRGGAGYAAGPYPVEVTFVAYDGTNLKVQRRPDQALPPLMRCLMASSSSWLAARPSQ